MQTYALVIAKDHEKVLKKCSDRVNSWKKADWLYDGIAYKEDLSLESLRDAIFSNSEFFPSVVIDNGSYLSADRFSEESWKTNVKKFIELTNDLAEISFYVLDLK